MAELEPGFGNSNLLSEYLSCILSWGTYGPMIALISQSFVKVPDSEALDSHLDS